MLIFKFYLQKFNFILIFSSLIFRDNFLRKIILKNERTQNKDKIEFLEINFENKHQFNPFF